MLVRGPKLSASKIVVDKIEETPQIKTRFNTEVVELQGEYKLSGIVVHDRTSGTTETIHPAGVFVFIGLSPNTAWLPPEIELDQNGAIVTRLTLEASMPGVFAAGDVRLDSTKQAASAAGEGATVALMIHDYLAKV